MAVSNAADSTTVTVNFSTSEHKFTSEGIKLSPPFHIILFR